MKWLLLLVLITSPVLAEEAIAPKKTMIIPPSGFICTEDCERCASIIETGKGVLLVPIPMVDVCKWKET